MYICILLITNNTKYENGTGYFSEKITTMWGFSMHLIASARPEHNPLAKRASSATLNAQSTATELGRDPDTHRNTPKPLACPAVDSTRKYLGRQRTPYTPPPKKKKVLILHRHISFYFRILLLSWRLRYEFNASRRGKNMLNSSRDKNEGTYRRVVGKGE